MLDAVYLYGWIFFVYAFLGWCAEVIFQALRLGEFVNRGFLLGPLCPIYGFGAGIIIFFLTPYQDNFWALFFWGIVLTTILEFFTGFVLEKVFHQKWWDYSNNRFNISGYVCLKFSLLWGFACVLVVDVIQPLVSLPIKILPKSVGWVLLITLFILVIADFVITLMAIKNIKRDIRLSEIEKRLKGFSDSIAMGLYKEAIKTKASVEEKQKELEEVKKEREKLGNKKKYTKKRIFKAFPNIKKVLGLHSEDDYDLNKNKEEEDE